MRTERGASWCLLLSLVGTGLAGYLVVPHLGLMRGELLGGAACGGSGAFNCHVVTGSAWGMVLGMPLAFWGLIGYVVVFALSLLARQSAEWAGHAMTLSFFLAVSFVAIDLVLLGLMLVVIRYGCLLCLTTYAINVTLLIVSARSLGRPWSAALRDMPRSLGALVPSSQRPAAGLFWGIVLVGVAAVVGLHVATTFVSRGTLDRAAYRQRIREFLAQQQPVRLDVSGDPFHGPADAPLQIIEFSDFRCPACQHASKMNPVLLADHRDDAVFIFKQYPLDATCNAHIPRVVHPGACRLAAAVECAHLQGGFWALHDVIFEEGPAYNITHLEGDVQRLGLDVQQFRACLASGEGMAAVKRDIAEGKKAGVTSTPTYVLNGIPMAGGLTPSAFEDFVAVLQERSR